MDTHSPAMRFDNSYRRELEGCFVPWQPATVPTPKLLYLNRELAAELGLDADSLEGHRGAAFFSGNALPEGAEPIAQAYAGHQFGNFSPQLGDGRAVLVGEVLTPDGRRVDIAFKGSGKTPFSRGGDGKAALGPMLREVLLGEAMHALGIPTTRMLAVAGTGEPVFRDSVQPGAVLTRVAASHLRVGTFEYFAARNDLDRVRILVDYAIARHDPDLVDAPDRALALLRAVAERQAALVAQWMNAGFIHGVMNTDNMTISGETIDYGPCAFMEGYNPLAVFSSIDRGGRYAYRNQPLIARWNLARLAEALLPLIDADPERGVARATEVLDAFPEWYRARLLDGQRAKLGLHRADTTDAADDAADIALADDWLDLLGDARADYTLAWRRLGKAAAGDEGPLRESVPDASKLDPWLARWRERCAREDGRQGASGRGDAGRARAAAERAARMDAVNPRIIPRNHRVEEALAAAANEDRLEPFERLLEALRRPYDDDQALAHYAEPAPEAVTACYKTFCGT